MESWRNIHNARMLCAVCPVDEFLESHPSACVNFAPDWRFREVSELLTRVGFSEIRVEPLWKSGAEPGQAEPVRIEVGGVPMDSEMAQATPFVGELDEDRAKDLLASQFGDGLPGSSGTMGRREGRDDPRQGGQPDRHRERHPGAARRQPPRPWNDHDRGDGRGEVGGLPGRARPRDPRESRLHHGHDLGCPFSQAGDDADPDEVGAGLVDPRPRIRFVRGCRTASPWSGSSGMRWCCSRRPRTRRTGSAARDSASSGRARPSRCRRGPWSAR